LAFAVLGGCGKKGPPLAPFSSAPAAPTEVTVRRKGDQVEIRYKVPIGNSDGRKPAKIDHVEVYGLTMPGEQLHKEGEEGKEGGKKGGGGKHGGGSGSRGGSRGSGAAGFGGTGAPGAGIPGAAGAGGHGNEMPFRKYGTVVSSVLVRKPPPPPKEQKEDE